MRPITASDLMNPEVLTVRDDLTVAELATFFIDNDISGAPVEDEGGRLVGVVSTRDIVAVAAEPDDEDDEDLEDEPGRSDFYEHSWERGLRNEVDDLDLEDLEDDEDDLRVSDLMNPDIYSVTEDAQVPEIATLMLEHHIHRLLVLRGDKVVGIISTSDLLGLLVGDE